MTTNVPAMGGLLEPCGKCGHLGFSHDNWDDCAECDCDGWRMPERLDDVPQRSTLPATGSDPA